MLVKCRKMGRDQRSNHVLGRGSEAGRILVGCKVDKRSPNLLTGNRVYSHVYRMH